MEGSDLIIIAGDLTAKDDEKGFQQFRAWLLNFPFTRIIIIAGNHDGYVHGRIMEEFYEMWNGNWITYLCDSGTEFYGLNIWGSPWVRSFNGMNQKAKAFTVDLEIQLREKFDLIPEDTDILITHSPPFGVLDGVYDMSYGFENQYKRRCGSTSLEYRLSKILPKLHVFGHIHENGGQQEYYYDDGNHSTTCVNASIVNERYEMVNKPIRIVL